MATCRPRVKSLQRRQQHPYSEALAEAASECPQRTALEWIVEDSAAGKKRTTRITFAEWNRLTLCTAWTLRGGGGAATDVLGGHLASLPVSPGQMVAFALETGPSLYALLTGVARVGGVPCPLDPKDSIETLQNVLFNFKPALVVVEDALCEKLRECFREIGLAVFSASDLVEAIATVTADKLEEELSELAYMYSPTDTALVTLTSGTTGVPKGVQITTRSLRSLHSIPFGGAAGTSLLYMGSCTWLSLHLHLVKALQHHTTLLLAPRYEKNLFFETLVERNIPNVMFWPMIMMDMLEVDADVIASLKSNVKQIVYGGAKAPPPLIIAAQRLLPDTDFLQGYGQSEIMHLGLLSPEDHKLALQADPLPEAVLRRLGSAGKPGDGTVLKIVGPDRETLEHGKVGMILAASLNAFSGYWRNETQTKKAITDDGWVVTGDYGYLDSDGYVHVEGRGAETIVLATGANVYPHEIEATLAELPGVREIGVAKVRTRLGKRLGSVDEVGVVVVPEDGVHFDPKRIEREIAEALQRRNAAAWENMTEGARLNTLRQKPFWVQIRNSKLPRNKNGKVLKKALGRRASSLVALSA